MRPKSPTKHIIDYQSMGKLNFQSMFQASLGHSMTAGKGALAETATLTQHTVNTLRKEPKPNKLNTLVARG